MVVSLVVLCPFCGADAQRQRAVSDPQFQPRTGIFFQKTACRECGRVYGIAWRSSLFFEKPGKER